MPWLARSIWPHSMKGAQSVGLDHRRVHRIALESLQISKCTTPQQIVGRQAGRRASSQLADIGAPQHKGGGFRTRPIHAQASSERLRRQISRTREGKHRAALPARYFVLTITTRTGYFVMQSKYRHGEIQCARFTRCDCCRGWYYGFLLFPPPRAARWESIPSCRLIRAASGRANTKPVSRMR